MPPKLAQTMRDWLAFSNKRIKHMFRMHKADKKPIPVHDVWCRKRADGVADHGHELAPQLLRVRLALHQRHVRVDALPLDGVVVADDGRLGALGVRDQGALDLGGADAVFVLVVGGLGGGVGMCV